MQWVSGILIPIPPSGPVPGALKSLRVRLLRLSRLDFLPGALEPFVVFLVIGSSGWVRVSAGPRPAALPVLIYRRPGAKAAK